MKGKFKGLHTLFAIEMTRCVIAAHHFTSGRAEHEPALVVKTPQFKFRKYLAGKGDGKQALANLEKSPAQQATAKSGYQFGGNALRDLCEEIQVTCSLILQAYCSGAAETHHERQSLHAAGNRID